MIHILIFRHGVPYKSLDVIRIPLHRTKETFAEMSQANGGIIRRDLRDEIQMEARAALAKIPFEQLPGADDASVPAHPACRSRRVNMTEGKRVQAARRPCSEPRD